MNKINSKGTIKTFQIAKNTNTLTKIAVLSTLAYIVMLIDFPIFFFPPFLKLDFSDMPALVASFAINPIAGVFVELVKNLFHFITKTQTGGVGELGNFLVGSVFVFTAGKIYHLKKEKSFAIIGCLLGTLAMSICAGFFNIYILIPFYANIMPIDAIISMGSAITPKIKDVTTLVLYSILPFNLLKGVIISLLTVAIYDRIYPVIKHNR